MSISGDFVIAMLDRRESNSLGMFHQSDPNEVHKFQCAQRFAVVAWVSMVNILKHPRWMVEF